jgi:hypothetical protein
VIFRDLIRPNPRSVGRPSKCSARDVSRGASRGVERVKRKLPLFHPNGAVRQINFGFLDRESDEANSIKRSEQCIIAATPNDELDPSALERVDRTTKTNSAKEDVNMYDHSRRLCTYLHLYPVG